MSSVVQPGVYQMIKYLCRCCGAQVVTRWDPSFSIPKRTRRWRRGHGARVQARCPVCGWWGRFSRCGRAEGERVQVVEWCAGSLYGEDL